MHVLHHPRLYHPKMTIRQRSSNGRAVRSAVTAEQDKRAWELRTLSLTYAQIATELGIGESTACESATRGAALIPTEGMVEAKKCEVAKLDRRERNMLALMTREDLKPEQRIAADLALDRIARRRAALCGLDEPAKYRVGVITEDVVDAEIRRLVAMLGEEDRLREVGLEP
jgi:hypothetical protein